jgi:hypothetical protein
MEPASRSRPDQDVRGGLSELPDALGGWQPALRGPVRRCPAVPRNEPEEPCGRLGV